MNDKEKESYPGRVGKKSSSKIHYRCLTRRNHAIEKSSYVRYMVDAMKKAGCEVCLEKHIVCEPCGPHVAGGYDPPNKQIVLCENNIYGQKHMNETLSHELIHSYDHCRAHVDWDDLKHLACTEIRAANLSGECFFWKENFLRARFGFVKHQQNCVRMRAAMSMFGVRDISKKEAYEVVDSVFDVCFKDTVPFERTPP